MTPTLVTCQLGTLVAGQTVTIAVTGKAIAVGTHVNTATVTGDGGARGEPGRQHGLGRDGGSCAGHAAGEADKPKPVETCASLIVTPKMIKADGKKDRVVAKVRSATKRDEGREGGRPLRRRQQVGQDERAGCRGHRRQPEEAGRDHDHRGSDKGDPCGAKRIGVVGVFLPPLDGLGERGR